MRAPHAEIVDGIYPLNRGDVLGLMMGCSWFDWRKSKSWLVPGAIGENLTSYGGILDERGKQTPISEFVRWGAAGTTGTVVEPYAIAAKFPDAVMHLNYARGLTLAESIYSSVRNPYQLLAMGDPLCRPWSDQQPMDLKGLSADELVVQQVQVHPVVSGDVQLTKPRFELFVDGRRLASCQPDQAFVLNTARLAVGYHEAVVTLEDDTNGPDLRAATRPVSCARSASVPVRRIGGLRHRCVWEPNVGRPDNAGYCPGPGFSRSTTGGATSHKSRYEQSFAHDRNPTAGPGPVDLTLVVLTATGSGVTCRPVRLTVIPASASACAVCAGGRTRRADSAQPHNGDDSAGDRVNGGKCLAKASWRARWRTIHRSGSPSGRNDWRLSNPNRV